jgi:predicted DNA-binding protein (UPF0251 family)
MSNKEKETRKIIDEQLRNSGWEADTINLRFSRGTRPVKGRNVCCLPEKNKFGPLGVRSLKEEISMAVDEYETIRLIDHEGMTQEECAETMNVARTTVQRIYNDARKKLAESLVDGKILNIEGGEYILYGENEQAYGCRRCRRHRNRSEEPI